MQDHEFQYIFHTTKIERLVVPEVVQSGSSDVVLDCQFAVPDDRFTLQWWFGSGERAGGAPALVYEWAPPLPPKIAGALEGYVDFSGRIRCFTAEECRKIHLVRMDPQLSGEYTCVVIHNGKRVQDAKHMLVFSPEEEFELMIDRRNNDLDITCFARGMYPQPDLVLEYDNSPISQQVQRVWRATGARYEAWGSARVAAAACARAACRLRLPQADYTAIKMKTFSPDNECNKGWIPGPLKLLIVINIVMHFKY